MLQFLLSTLLLASPPASLVPIEEDLQELVSKLEALKDDADPEILQEIAALGTREAAVALTEASQYLSSIYMRIELVRALASFDGHVECEKLAIEQVLQLATQAKQREVRLAAIEAAAEFQDMGGPYLKLVVDALAPEDVRLRALRLHAPFATDADLDWYEGLFRPLHVAQAPKPPATRKSTRKPRNPQAPEPKKEEEKRGPRLERLRVGAFAFLASRLEAERLHTIFEKDVNPKIRVAALQELFRQEGSDLEELASSTLEAISAHPLQRIEAARILAEIQGADAAEQFIDLARKKEVTPEALRAALADELANMGEKAERKVEKLIGKGKPHQRVFALKACRNTDAGKLAFFAQCIPPCDQVIPVRRFENTFQHGMKIAGIVSRSWRDFPRKFVLANQIPRTHLDTIEAEILGDTLDTGLNRKIRRRLPEPAHGYLPSLIRRNGDCLIFDRVQPVRPAQRRDRLAEL